MMLLILFLKTCSCICHCRDETYSLLRMLSGVSNFIKKNLSLKQESSDSGNQAQRPGDRVEDGFLLVGDSASERNTVYTNSYRANQAELPPGYSEVTMMILGFRIGGSWKTVQTQNRLLL